MCIDCNNSARNVFPNFDALLSLFTHQRFQSSLKTVTPHKFVTDQTSRKYLNVKFNVHIDNWRWKRPKLVLLCRLMCTEQCMEKYTKIQIFTLFLFATESDLFCYISVYICMYNKTLKLLLGDYKK